MSIISFASPKGGCGKTTSALLLGTELAEKGYKVTIIDADPETWIAKWAERPDKPKNLRVIKSPTEETIIDEIRKASEDSQFVIIDLEGTANMLVADALRESDLVLLPMQGSELDAQGASKAQRLVKQQEKAFRRQIPHAFLFTRTKAAFQTKTLRNIQDQLDKVNAFVFQTQIIDREVYRALFSFGGTLSKLDPKGSYKLDDAILNARSFAGEVIKTLKNRWTGEPVNDRSVEKHQVGVA